MSQSTQPALFRSSDNNAVAHVTQAYGELLKNPQWSIERQAKVEKLKAYAQSLWGYERELIQKYYPDLFTTSTPNKQ